MLRLNLQGENLESSLGGFAPVKVRIFQGVDVEQLVQGRPRAMATSATA